MAFDFPSERKKQERMNATQRNLDTNRVSYRQFCVSAKHFRQLNAHFVVERRMRRFRLNNLCNSWSFVHLFYLLNISYTAVAAASHNLYSVRSYYTPNWFRIWFIGSRLSVMKEKKENER